MRGLVAFARGLALALACAVVASPSQGQPTFQLQPPPLVASQAKDFEFHAPSAAADPSVVLAMQDLAGRLLPIYEEPQQERYFSNLSALQLVAHAWEPADTSRQSLAERRAAVPGWPVARAVFLDLYARAKAHEAAGGVTFAHEYAQAFHELVPQMTDRQADDFNDLLARPASAWQKDVQAAFDGLRTRDRISFAEALDLVWKFLYFDAARTVASLAPALDVEDYRRRYEIADDGVIRTRGNTEIVARFIRPKGSDQPLPALLEFNLHVSEASARASAAHGYVGVVAYPRLKEGRKGPLIPFRHDGDDVRAVIAWIVKQPWSDGRVGVVGSGYGGFAAWAAAKKPPPALKAIVTSDATAPGIDFPMERGVWSNAALRWAEENTQGVADPVLEDDATWQARDLAWYQSGKGYRFLDKIAMRPNGVFQRWLSHPSYDGYWRKMVPYGADFAKLDVPVLSTTGTYAGGSVGAAWYFMEHLKHRPGADHTLLIGPWSERSLLESPVAPAPGAPLDTAAQIDLRELRFAWLDHVFKGTPVPPLLSARVNVQVPGTNRWRHAESLDALAATPRRFWLEPTESGERLRLVDAAPAGDAFLQQVVKLADRSDPDRAPMTPIVARNLAVPYSLAFVSEPLAAPMEVAGLARLHLDFKPNKMDADFNLSLYELLENGDYVRLADPDEFRASYVKDRVHRRLLQAGVRQTLDFTGGQVVSRRLAAGSRLVVVLGVNKRPDREVNYGAGDDVSMETRKRNARTPLAIRWYGGSYVDVPVQP